MANSGKNPGFLKNSAQKFFFAGLGALSIAEEKGARFMDELVDRGRKYDIKGKERVEEAGETLTQMKQAAESCKEVFEKILDEKLKKAIRKFGIPSSEEIDILTKRVETLVGSVDFLLSRHEGGDHPLEGNNSNMEGATRS